jgi:tryptophan-rich sensory protein
MGEIASPSQLRMSFLRWALVTVPLVLLLGLGSWLLSGGGGYRDPWFKALVKPPLTPEPGTFAATWAILYVLVGFALAFVVDARRAEGRGLALTLFVVQFLLALAWAPLFFAGHQVSMALLVALLLLVLATLTLIRFAMIRRRAGLLMLPYLAWLFVIFLLNYEVNRLNPDAEALVPQAPSTQVDI